MLDDKDAIVLLTKKLLEAETSKEYWFKTCALTQKELDALRRQFKSGEGETNA